MKKLVVLLGIMMVFLCGCGKSNPDNVVKDFMKNVKGVKSYKVTGTMEISNDEETFNYSLESYYLKDNYYKVVLVNQTNNHEQIILKNNDDVYVITPALNKSFKFQSEWPTASSQAYLLNSIVNDIENDKNYEVTENDDGFIIKTKVNYPNNDELGYQKIYLNDKKEIDKVEVYNTNDIVKIKVTFSKVDLKAGLKEDDFKLEDYVKEEEPKEEDCEDGSACKDDSNSKETATIEDIIYPLYIPSNTYLTSSEKVDTDTGNRVILTFSGDKNFVLIEEKAVSASVMEVIPVYGEPLLLSESVGALSANSLSWDANDMSYYLASTELTPSEMMLIANSLGNETLVANTK